MTAIDTSPTDTALTEKGNDPTGWLLLSVLVLLAGWATSVMTWGIPGLYVPAVAAVPLIWILLLVISRI